MQSSSPKHCLTDGFDVRLFWLLYLNISYVFYMFGILCNVINTKVRILYLLKDFARYETSAWVSGNTKTLFVEGPSVA